MFSLKQALVPFNLVKLECHSDVKGLRDEIVVVEGGIMRIYNFLKPRPYSKTPFIKWVALPRNFGSPCTLATW